MILLKYAILNLGRKKKQTLFSILCILVSSFIVLADFGLINGMEESLKEAINRVLSGQVTVYSSDKDGINILEAQISEQTPFVWGDNDIKALDQEFPELQFNQRIRIGSLISFQDETSYAHLHALEGNHLERINSMFTFIEGKMASKVDEIVISETIAKDIHCTVGDTVLLVANNVYDYMTDAIGIVSGIFEEKGIAVFLGYNGFIPLNAGKNLAEINETECLELIINPKDERDLTEIEFRSIANWFDDNYPGLRLVTWEQTAPLLYSIVKVWQGGGMLMQIMFTVFSLIILITLTSLVVRSRKKEFGTLLAIGFSWKRIKFLVCFEYALLCSAAVLIGFGLLEILFSLISTSGIVIESKDMQSALMTDKLFPFIYMKDLIYVWFLFQATTMISTLISIRRLQKININSLIKG